MNPVNCVGVMGAGLARQFRDKYPKNYVAYSIACANKECTIGTVFPFKENGKLIVNFPTKNDWRFPSRIEYIEKGLPSLLAVLAYNNIKSVAIPQLGCGLGGLNWKDVKPLILETFKDIEIELDIYE